LITSRFKCFEMGFLAVGIIKPCSSGLYLMNGLKSLV
jgi:hypothetical protein